MTTPRSNSFDLSLDTVFDEQFFKLNTKQEFEQLQITFPVPQTTEELTRYYDTHNSKDYTDKRADFISGVHALLLKIENWALQNGVAGTESLKKFQANFNFTQHLDYMKKSLPLFNEGLPFLVKISDLLLNDSIPLDKRKLVLTNLLNGIDVCGPGAHTNIFSAFMELTTDPRFEMDAIKFHIAQQTASEILNRYKSFFIQLPIQPGDEIHYINGMLNYFSTVLGIQFIEDNFISQDLHLQHLCFGFNATNFSFDGFRNSIRGAMSLENVFNTFFMRFNLAEKRKKILEQPNESKNLMQFLDTLGADESLTFNTLFDEFCLAQDEYYLRFDSYYYLTNSIYKRLCNSHYFKADFQSYPASFENYFLPSHSILFAYVKKGTVVTPYCIYAMECLLKGDCEPYQLAQKLGFEEALRYHIIKILTEQAIDYFTMLQDKILPPEEQKEFEQARLTWFMRLFKFCTSSHAQVLNVDFISEILRKIKSEPKLQKTAEKFFSEHTPLFDIIRDTGTPEALVSYLSILDEEARMGLQKSGQLQKSKIHALINSDINLFAKFLDALNLLQPSTQFNLYHLVINEASNIVQQLSKLDASLILSLANWPDERLKVFFDCNKSAMIEIVINTDFKKLRTLPSRFVSFMMDYVLNSPYNHFSINDWLQNKPEKLRIYYLQLLTAANIRTCIPDGNHLDLLLKNLLLSDVKSAIDIIGYHITAVDLYKYTSSKHFENLKRVFFHKTLSEFMVSYPNFDENPIVLFQLIEDPKYFFLFSNLSNLIEILQIVQEHNRLTVLIMAEVKHTLLINAEPTDIEPLIEILAPQSAFDLMNIIRIMPFTQIPFLVESARVKNLLNSGSNLQLALSVVGQEVANEFLSLFSKTLHEKDLSNFADNPEIFEKLRQGISKKIIQSNENMLLFKPTGKHSRDYDDDENNNNNNTMKKHQTDKN